MRNRPVHWHEGMFLRPQHFQAADRHWEEQVAVSSRWDNAYNYGLRSIELSRDALANYQVQVTVCEARMRDGTLVCFAAGQAPDRVDLKECFAAEADVIVYLALPKLALGRPNVGAHASGDHRYVVQTLAVQDESQGGNDQELQFLDIAVRLLLSTQAPTGFELLPIARIRRAGQDEATPELDDDYIPPVLAIDAWSPLGTDIVRAIYDIVGRKIEVLSARIAERSINLTSQDPGDLDDLLMLSLLNQAYAVVHCLTFAQGVHPFVCYVELCRVVGMLAIFDPTRRIADIPKYDHDDLARIFKWIKARLETLLGTTQKLDYEQRFFVGTERGMQVSIKPEWLHSGWQWFVGVNGHNITENECRDLLRPGKLDWKMGSSQQVDLIFKHGMPGVEQIELVQAPRALPARRGWVYYELKRENAAWKDVLATQALALRYKTELIGNLDSLQGQRKLEVLLGDRRAVLEFALFAVPTLKQ
ncbi:MAG: type VI secretion system baseplate subunit TssK [Pirellulaceae bacterium]